MKKIFLCASLAVLSLSPLMAQESGPEIEASQIGVTTAQQKLKEVSVSKMEDAGLWYGTMSGDDGFLQFRRFEGSPMDKKPIEGEVEAGINEPDKYVLGAKVSFLRRSMSTFSIKPVRPLPIEGITKTISVWAAGRNTNHELEVVISDHFGNKAYINMGKLNFVGWKQLTVSVPPSIIQRDYHYNDKMGITLEGFNIKCDLDETYGNYYIYLDDVRAVTDLFAEESRDPDDIIDSW